MLQHVCLDELGWMLDEIDLIDYNGVGNYCGIIIVRWGPMFVAFVANLCYEFTSLRTYIMSFASYLSKYF